MRWSEIKDVILPILDGGVSIAGWAIVFGVLGLMIGIAALIIGYRAAVACHWPTESRAWGIWARRAVGLLALFALLGAFTTAGAGWGACFGLKRHVKSKHLVEQASAIGLEPLLTQVCALIFADQVDLASSKDASQEMASLVATFQAQGGTIPLATIESKVTELKKEMIELLAGDSKKDVDNRDHGKISGLVRYVLEKALTLLANASAAESEKILKDVLAELRSDGIETAAPKEIGQAIGKVYLRPWLLQEISKYANWLVLFCLLPGVLIVFVASLLCDVVARVLKCHCGTTLVQALH